MEESKVAQYWTFCSSAYQAKIEEGQIQSYSTIAFLTQAFHKKRILEVACGPGLHSLFFMNSISKPGTVLFLTDISRGMLELAEKKYTDPEGLFSQCPNNKFFREKELLSEIHVEATVERHQDPQGRLVYACLADNQNLPFGNESFEAYLSSLTLMAMTDKVKNISEAFRVLKKGSYAGFTIWGRRENTKVHTILEDVLTKNGIAFQKNNNEMAENSGVWIEEFKKAGFQEVKFWFQPNQMLVANGEDYYDALTGLIPPMIQQKLTPEIKKQLVEEYDKQCGQGVLDPSHFEVAIIIAFKP